jgi:actin-like ATPase involved in cell morphogenesis/Tfp pilus assembly protein PilZ
VRWWQVFVDKLTRRSKDAAVLGPRRRADTRYVYRAHVEAKCSSWPNFQKLFTGDVSAHGLFVPTDAEAKIGERIEVKLMLPDGTEVAIGGAVVAVVDAETAQRVNKPRGLGVKLDDLSGEMKARFEALLAAARDAQPHSADEGFDIDVDVDERGSVQRPMPTAAENDLLFPEPEAPAPAAPKAAPAAPAPSARAAIAKAAPRAGRIIGIDLGTTYTAVAAARQGRVTVLQRPDGERSIPSVVSFPSRGQIVVGAAARARTTIDPKHTVASPKRLLGRRFDDRVIENFLVQAAWTSERAPDDTVLVEMHGEKYAVTQLCSYILADARDAAEQALGERVDRAVITVPVSFDEMRLKLLRRAAQLARLEVVATIDEPSAAALANRFQPGFGGVVGIYDFGGGTFDFTIVDVSGGDFKVLATAGDAWLGGDDFDIAMAEAVANQIYRMHQLDLRKDAVEWAKLLYGCERAKRALSVGTSTEIHVPELLRTAQGKMDLAFRLDRGMLERLVAPVVERSIQTCGDALALLDMKPSDLSAVYLSGGTTYMPAVRSAIARYFGVPIKTGVPPDHAVCIGAGIHAAQLEIQGHATLDAH